MARLSKEHKDALKTPEGSKVLVQSLNKEIVTLKKTIVQTQDELGNAQDKYHAVDKDNSVLRYIASINSGIEIIKFAISAIGTGYGVNEASDGKQWGWLIVLASAALYAAITKWQLRANMPNVDEDG